MNASFEPVREITRELVRRKLWPIAVLLLVAIVAVPVVIVGGSPAAPPPAAGPDVAAVAGTTTAPQASPSARSLEPTSGGRVRNPFFDPPVRASEASGGGSRRASLPAANTTASAKPAASAPKAASKPATKAPASATPAKPAVSPPPATTGAYQRTVVRLNAAGGGRAHAISRLTPLGGAADPAALFLGVTDNDDRYAVFVLGPHATSHGAAICNGRTSCRMIGLKAGDTQTVTLRRPDGAVRLRFTLRVESIRTVTIDAARAATLRSHVHPDARTATSRPACRS